MCRLEFDTVTFVLLKIFQLICKPMSGSSCLHKHRSGPLQNNKIHISKELYRPTSVLSICQKISPEKPD